MKANRAYRLIVSREGIEPAFLADRDRLDRIEVVSIDDGEVTLYWDLPAKEASRLLKALRSDLVRVDAGEFIRIWEGADAGGERRGSAAARYFARHGRPSSRPGSSCRREGRCAGAGAGPIAASDRAA
jgi:hypothetical protein